MPGQKAIALFSGGLDSLLSVKVMHTLGYKIAPVFFRTPFFGEARAVQTAEANGISLLVKDITPVYWEMFLHPQYGYGKHFNPCIDCHALMFQQAGEMLEELKADFLISGEVLGQRPMSQRKDSLAAVGKLSQYRDLLIRPLSQRLLPDTLPILNGWVDKEQLLALNGRSRKPQLALARQYGIEHYPSPAGGCRLTDKNYAVRLKDLQRYNQLDLPNIALLEYGRHFRLSPTVKCIIGRDEQDNARLQALRQGEIFLLHRDILGPLGILSGSDITEADLLEAASLLAFYQKKATDPCTILYGTGFPLTQTMRINKAAGQLIREKLIRSEHAGL